MPFGESIDDRKIGERKEGEKTGGGSIYISGDKSLSRMGERKVQAKAQRGRKK